MQLDIIDGNANYSKGDYSFTLDVMEWKSYLYKSHTKYVESPNYYVNFPY